MVCYDQKLMCPLVHEFCLVKEVLGGCPRRTPRIWWMLQLNFIKNSLMNKAMKGFHYSLSNRITSPTGCLGGMQL